MRNAKQVEIQPFSIFNIWKYACPQR